MTAFQRLSTLSSRDKKTLILGLIAAVILITVFAWRILTSQFNAAHQAVQQSRQLLAWIQNADTRLRGVSSGQPSTPSKETLASVTQTILTESGMASHIKRLRQNEKGAVDLSLTSVDFDKLLTALNHIKNRSGAIPVQINITRTADTGGVNTDMLLQN